MEHSALQQGQSHLIIRPLWKLSSLMDVSHDLNNIINDTNIYVNSVSIYHPWIITFSWV